MKFSSDSRPRFTPDRPGKESEEPVAGDPLPWRPSELELPEEGVASPPPLQPLTPEDTIDVEALIELARDEGRRAGIEEGRVQEAQRFANALDTLEHTMDAIRAAEAQRAAEAPDVIAALATAIAGHLVEREVRAAPELVSDLVRHAVAEFLPSEPLKVRLNPADLALLSSGMVEGSGREHLTNGQVVRWIPDPSIRAGGCLVEGSDRIMDGRMETTLERVYRALTDA
jgi:flagellar biosynthesis/type III secretory pathway protein FliH